jgi:membrane associated rhomboid family serine protease
MLPLRDENPTSRTAVVTVALILVNVAVFLFVQPRADTPEGTGYVYEYAAIPCELVEGRPLTAEEIPDFNGGDETACQDAPTSPTIFPDKRVYASAVVSMFLHSGWLHLAANMLFLWIFGNNVEDHLGRIRYLLFYLAGGIVATAAYVVFRIASTVPVIGASGAVAAVMGAYLVWFPAARVLTLVLVIPIRIRAFWLLAFWFVAQFFMIDVSDVAVMAHVGGFVFGVVVGLVVRESAGFRRRMWTSHHQSTGDGMWDSRRGGRHEWFIPPYEGPIDQPPR